jgi:hypothetical protein
MKKVYFATPVNGRTEPTLAEKKEAALARCVEVRNHLKRLHPDWVICYSFMVCPINYNLSRDHDLTEAEAMGRCVTLLMSCDMLITDNIVLTVPPTQQSKGCKLEWFAAEVYGIERKFLNDIFTEKKIVKL